MISFMSIRRAREEYTARANGRATYTRQRRIRPTRNCDIRRRTGAQNGVIWLRRRSRGKSDYVSEPLYCVSEILLFVYSYLVVKDDTTYTYTH